MIPWLRLRCGGLRSSRTNAKLRKVVADLSLDKEMLQDRCAEKACPEAHLVTRCVLSRAFQSGAGVSCD